MGTLVCPLCCDEEFPSQQSLRYHLLSITDNVYCPECNTRFDSILLLANHLDGMCGKSDIPLKIEETITTENYKEVANEKPESVPVPESVQVDEISSQVVTDAADTEECVSEPDLSSQLEIQIDEGDPEALIVSEENVEEQYEVVEQHVEDAESQEYYRETQEDVSREGCEEVGISSTSELPPSSSDTEVPEAAVEEYSCSACGMTFNSVMEHIKMYHDGQEVVVEVPDPHRVALDGLMTPSDTNPASEERNGNLDTYVEESSAELPETSEVKYEEQNNPSLSYLRNKSFLSFKEKTRVVADEEKLKKIVPPPKKQIKLLHSTDFSSGSELKLVSKEVKIGRFWENQTNQTNEVQGVRFVRKYEKMRDVKMPVKRDTRSSIEKLFSGDFLLSGLGGHGSRPTSYLGSNRIPEVKVIMSPGDSEPENAISVYTCSNCNKEFGNMSGFERHSCTVAKSYIMVCKYCNANFADISSVKLHMEVTHNIKTSLKTESSLLGKRKYQTVTLPLPLKCSTCDVTFTTLRALKLHSKVHEPVEEKVRFVCTVCHNECSSNRTLNQHMKIHSENEVVVKKDTQEVVEEVEGTSTNSEKEDKLGMLVCKMCGKSFEKNEDLRAHWQEHAAGKQEKEEQEKPMEEEEEEASDRLQIKEDEAQPSGESVESDHCHKDLDKTSKEDHMGLLGFECSVCNKSFSKPGHLNLHMRIHRGDKDYSCSHCSKVFANMNLLRTHIQSHKVQRPYPCGFCGHGFFRHHDRVEHERIHTGEKPYSCSVCGMRFRVRYCLTLHMRRHTGIRPYMCKICNKTFRTGTAFKAHTKIHLDERAYKCPMCPKKFNTLIQLSGHKNSHTKPYSCMECNRPFSSLYAVKKHMVSHEEGSNGKDPLKFQCKVCGASYARRFALRDHLKSHGHDIPATPGEKNGSDESSCDNVS